MKLFCLRYRFQLLVGIFGLRYAFVGRRRPPGEGISGPKQWWSSFRCLRFFEGISGKALQLSRFRYCLRAFFESISGKAMQLSKFRFFLRAFFEGFSGIAMQLSKFRYYLLDFFEFEGFFGKTLKLSISRSKLRAIFASISIKALKISKLRAIFVSISIKALEISRLRAIFVRISIKALKISKLRFFLHAFFDRVSGKAT